MIPQQTKLSTTIQQRGFQFIKVELLNTPELESDSNQSSNQTFKFL